MDKVNYNPTTWVDRTSVTQGSIIDANSMNNIEKGIVDVTRAINTLITNPPVVGGDGTIVQKGEDGLSAFQLAQQEGFEGTLEEWLESLKGDKGDTGEQGERGETGPQGPQGEPGRDGVSPDITGFKEEISNKCIAIEQKVNDHIENSSNEGSGIKRTDMVDYMGVQHDNIKDANDSNVEYILRKVNTTKYESSTILAKDTVLKQVRHAVLKGVTKYRDNASNELGERFQEGHDLISAKNPILTIKNRIEGVSEGKIVFSPHDNTQLVNVIDSSNFTIKTTGSRHQGAVSNPFFIQDLGGVVGCKYIIEFDGKLLTGDLSNSIGVELSSWSDFTSGYNGKLPEDGKYRAIVKCNTNPDSNRRTKITIKPSTSVTNVSNKVEYQIRNLKIYPVKNDHETFQSNKVTINGEFGAVNDYADTVDLVTGEVVYYTALRQYEEGDETNNQVITDMEKTRYILDQPITQHIDLGGQKVYSFDGTTYYTCTSLNGHPAPILDIEVPTDVSTLIGRQQNEIKQLADENSELKKRDNLLVARTWDLDFSLNEVEWLLKESLIIQDSRNSLDYLRGTLSNVSISKYEQAMLLINSGVFIKDNLIKQLTVYLNRNYLSQEEYSDLVSLLGTDEIIPE